MSVLSPPPDSQLWSSAAVLPLQGSRRVPVSLLEVFAWLAWKTFAVFFARILLLPPDSGASVKKQPVLFIRMRSFSLFSFRDDFCRVQIFGHAPEPLDA